MCEITLAHILSLWDKFQSAAPLPPPPAKIYPIFLKNKLTFQMIWQSVFCWLLFLIKTFHNWGLNSSISALGIIVITLIFSCLPWTCTMVVWAQFFMPLRRAYIIEAGMYYIDFVSTYSVPALGVYKSIWSKWNILFKFWIFFKVKYEFKYICLIILW